MTTIITQPSLLKGTITLPASKSQTMRALVFASLASGQSQINNVLPSPDTQAMKAACKQAGAIITEEGTRLLITGIAGRPKRTDSAINCGNSGQVLRFMTAISALSAHPVVYTGDESIRHRRPMGPLLNGLRQLGAKCTCLAKNGLAPVQIKGPIQAGQVKINGSDSQPVSALLIVASQLAGKTTIEVEHLGEKPWIELTISWLQKFGVPVSVKQNTFCIKGIVPITPFQYSVPCDLSALAFPVVAALITNSAIRILGVDLSEPQGDKVILTKLGAMGAQFEYNVNTQILFVPAGQKLVGAVLDVNDCIDAVPALAVAACYAHSKTHIVNGAVARVKESDRLASIAKELTHMGARITEKEDGLIICPSQLRGETVYSHQDHRIAMALTVAGLAASGKTFIKNTACIEKSFPNFSRCLNQLAGIVAELA